MNNKKRELADLNELMALLAHKKGCLEELNQLIQSKVTETNARSFRFMLNYYGLTDRPALTLEAIGETIAEGLSRERVRQIIDNGLTSLKKEELENHNQPYKKTIEIVDALLKEQGQLFVNLKTLEEHDYFKSFSENGSNSKGLIAFLNDAGLKQVVYRGDHYVYPKEISRSVAIKSIQSNKKFIRKTKTLTKMNKMAKTVTYVPAEVRAFLLEQSEKTKENLNRIYEKVLTEFMQSDWSSSGFEKTQSWKARKGKSEWVQVGIYIDKEVFNAVKLKSAKVKPKSIATMAYICQAFIAYQKGLIHLNH